MIITPSTWDEETSGTGDMTTFGFEAMQTLD
jgi:hypothetical protein